MFAFLGLIVFPKWDKHIDIRLAGMVKALTTMESPTIIHMILADMFRALTKCINGKMYFEGCNILLQIWFWNIFITMIIRAPRSIIYEQSEMVVEKDKGKVVPGYLSWFHDLVTFGDTPEGSSRKIKDQHTIRQLEKELEKAKATIA
ncbi:hypothetical protein KY284_012974 [Solanum tuberosum]|nr:hypothetical protein KY284_012974 [Solanum tuberosum]